MEIFAGHCGTSKCHGGFRPKHQMELVTWQGLKGHRRQYRFRRAARDETGAARRPRGELPVSSRLPSTAAGRPAHKMEAMPYEERPPFGEKRLADAQISTLEEWIKQGAPLE